MHKAAFVFCTPINHPSNAKFITSLVPPDPGVKIPLREQLTSGVASTRKPHRWRRCRIIKTNATGIPTIAALARQAQCRRLRHKRLYRQATRSHSQNPKPQ